MADEANYQLLGVKFFHAEDHGSRMLYFLKKIFIEKKTQRNSAQLSIGNYLTFRVRLVKSVFNNSPFELQVFAAFFICPYTY